MDRAPDAYTSTSVSWNFPTSSSTYTGSAEIQNSQSIMPLSPSSWYVGQYGTERLQSSFTVFNCSLTRLYSYSTTTNPLFSSLSTVHRLPTITQRCCHPLGHSPFQRMRHGVELSQLPIRWLVTIHSMEIVIPMSIPTWIPTIIIMSTVTRYSRFTRKRNRPWRMTRMTEWY